MTKSIKETSTELKTAVAAVLQELGYVKQTQKRMDNKMSKISDNILVCAAKYILVAYDIKLYDIFIKKYNLNENLCKFSAQEIETISCSLKTLKKLTTKRKAV